MRCALINSATNTVENLIMADPAKDQAPQGYTLVALADSDSTEIGWTYSPTTGQFTDPFPAPAPAATP